MIKSDPRIHLFVLTFPPLFAYLQARDVTPNVASSGGSFSFFSWEGGSIVPVDSDPGGNVYKGGGNAEEKTWDKERPDTFENRRSCGCGGDRCEKIGCCHTQGFITVCCNNVCRCMNTKVQGFSRDMDRKCELCDQMERVTKNVCRDVIEDEFSCWRQHMDPVPKPDLEQNCEYIYA